MRHVFGRTRGRVTRDGLTFRFLLLLVNDSEGFFGDVDDGCQVGDAGAGGGLMELRR